MNNQNLDKIIKKIQALWAKAQGTDIEAESLAFAKKAKELLQEYNLSEEILGKPQINQNNYLRSFKRWHQVLATATARYFGCSVYFERAKSRGSRLRVVAAVFTGQPAAQKTAFVMFEHFEKAIQRAAIKSGYSHIELDVFVESAATSLALKLHRDATLDAELSQNYNDAKSFEENGANFSFSKFRPTITGRAGSDGLAAGKAISINLQVSKSQNNGAIA